MTRRWDHVRGVLPGGLLLCLLGLPRAASAAPGPQPPPCAPQEGYARTELRFPRRSAKLAARDFDGDGALDLLFVEREGFGLRRMRPDGTWPAEHDAFLPLPSTRLAWDLAPLGPGGRWAVVAMVGGEEVRAYALDEEGAFGAGVALLEARGYIPRGVSRVDFVRDVDGDGREDLIVPVGGRYRIHLALEAGGFAAPIELAYEAEIGYDLGDPERLDAGFGQRVRIPWFRIEDVDGDGTEDLVSETEDEVLVHLARPELPAEPSWRLDLAALREELPRRDGVDLDDLLANIEPRVDWRVEELDGVAPKDLVLQLGSSFRVYLGAAATGPGRTPDQILKLSGNLLYFFVRDVQGSPLPDLQLVRGEKISLGTVIRWLVLPGSVDFDLFTYENEGGAFSRRPSRQNRVSIELPRLLALADEAEEIEALMDHQASIPARRFAAQADGVEDDVVDLVGEQLLVYHDCAGARRQGEVFGEFRGDMDELLEVLILRDLDRQGDGGTRTIDLGEVKSWQFSPGAALREACAGAAPAERIPLSGAGQDVMLRVADLDGDGRSDFVVVGEEDGDAGALYVLHLVVRRP